MKRDVACKAVGNMISGMQPEEIRKLFNIDNGKSFTFI
jgi:hypothetical protein